MNSVRCKTFKGREFRNRKCRQKDNIEMDLKEIVQGRELHLSALGCETFVDCPSFIKRGNISTG
jgi:hypothetical protein